VINIGDWTKKWSHLQPQKRALIFEDRPFTYQEVNQRTNQLSHLLLELGARKGDRIAVLLRNGHPYIEILFALSKIGAILVPLNWRLAGPELKFLIKDSGSRMLVFEREFEEIVDSIRPDLNLSQGDYLSVGEPHLHWARDYESNLLEYPFHEPLVPEPVGDEDPHVLMYTSGTTGVPKGTVLSHRKTFFNALNADFFYHFTPKDVMIITRPLFHSGGLFVDAIPVLYKGGTLILRRHFRPPEVFETIEKYRVTLVEMAGTLFQFLLQECDPHRYDLGSVRCYFTGGERIAPAMLKEYHAKGIVISQVFGLTETSTITWLPYEDAIRKMGSVGLPIFHGDVKIVNKTGQEVRPDEVGEIIVSGPALMSGYWNRPDLTAETIQDGWLHTGDLAKKDEEGYIYIVDREKDMYISGGENVYPAEIEKVFFTHPKIFDAAVIGVPDEKWGEVGKAFIVSKPGERMDPDEVLDFIRGKLAKYKIPRYVEFVKGLPKTPSGKILKNLLKTRSFGSENSQPSPKCRDKQQKSP
jgi:fatty-acyl-CoA synthase